MLVLFVGEKLKLITPDVTGAMRLENVVDGITQKIIPFLKILMHSITAHSMFTFLKPITDIMSGYGHYVGHTGNIEARIRTHLANGSPQTAGGYPTKVWQSSPFKTREAAAHYEAVLKCWRDKRDYQFEEKTKMKPKPFKNPNIVRYEAADGWVASLFTIIITCILLFLFLAFIFKL